MLSNQTYLWNNFSIEFLFSSSKIPFNISEILKSPEVRELKSTFDTNSKRLPPFRTTCSKFSKMLVTHFKLFFASSLHVFI